MLALLNGREVTRGLKLHCKIKVPIRSLPTSCSHLSICPRSYHCTSLASLWSGSCFLEGRCLRFISCCSGKMPSQKQLKGDRLYLTHSSWFQSIALGSQGRQQELEGVNHITSTIKSRERYINAWWLALNSSSFGS